MVTHMQTNELDNLVGGVPPRQVDVLTAVSGHNISNSNARPAICECGARQPADWTATPTEWRETHLQEAWPEVRRADGETAEAFLARLSDLYVAASMREQGIEEAQGQPAHRARRGVPRDLRRVDGCQRPRRSHRASDDYAT
jgi:hypothetical protein